VRSLGLPLAFGCWILLIGVSAQQINAQGVEVSAKILMRAASDSAGKKHKASSSAENVVIWLSPAKPGSLSPLMPVRQTPYRLVQKNKMFTPHLLVVPTGSSVQFPNEDPFFHNVFSLFNGKRFDLGLYESGTSRSVRFDREGVSYIFCNIHPEMGAVILALSTPLYGISGENGVVSVHNVPPGSYWLNIWSENAQAVNQTAEGRIIQVSTEPVRLGEITLQTATDALTNHKNKFGEDYPPVRDPSYQK
jgi:plastocyanin